MGSNLSCVDSKPGGAPVGNVYDEAFDGDGPDESSVSPGSGPSSSSPPPSTTSNAHHRTGEHQNTIGSSHNNNEHKTTEKQFTHKVPVFPPNSKAAKYTANQNNGSNVSISHDAKGYAMVFPKNGKPQTNSGNSQISSQTKEKNTEKIDSKNGVGVKAFKLPTATNKDSRSGKSGAKEKSKETSKNDQANTGDYCNVVLADDKETKSYSNELYDDAEAQAPKVPETTRTVPKISKGPEKSQNAQLNYIQVEFVKPTKVTSNRPKAKRSPSTTQYTDVISENGKVRLVD